MGSISPSTERTTLLRLAAKRLGAISKGEFTANVRAKASSCLLDFIASAQTGLRNPVSVAVQKYTQRRPGNPEAYAFGTKNLVSAETAAFNNTVIAHSTARDDMHLDSCSHMGGIVVSAVLALSERDHWSGEQIIRGMVGGYEMGAVLGHSIRGGGTFNAQLRPSGLIGAFAATAAAVAATGLEEELGINALALAINQAAGYNEWAWSGGLELFIHNGTASRAGIIAYDLAKCGVPASDTALEGRDGMFSAVYAGPGAADLFTKWLSTSPVGRGILEVCFKPIPTCNFTQTSSSLALKIQVNPMDVEKIIITTTSAAISYPGCDNAGPLEPSMGALSIQYGVCAALVFGKLDADALGRVEDPAVNHLMSKCSLKADAQYDESYQKGLQPAKVEVVVKDGIVHVESGKDVPWLNAEEVKDRFLKDVSSWLADDEAKILLQRCQRLGETGFDGGLLSALALTSD